MVITLTRFPFALIFVTATYIVKSLHKQTKLAYSSLDELFLLKEQIMLHIIVISFT